MDKLRSWVGMVSPASASGGVRSPMPALSAEEAEQKRSALIRTKRLELESLEEEAKEIEQDIADAARDGKAKKLKELLTRRDAIAAEKALVRGQLDNQLAASKTIGRAESNRDQALLYQQAAGRLTEIQKETDRLDLDEILDNYQEGSSVTKEHSDRLARPLESNTIVDEDVVDDEVQALIDRAAEERRLTMPDPVTTKPQPASPTVQLRQRKLHLGGVE
jgi:hypothetical protein